MFVLVGSCNRSKKPQVDWCIEMLENTMAVLQKTFIKSSQVTNHGSMRMRLKKKSTFRTFEDKPNPTKVVCGRSTLKQMVARFFGKTRHVARFHLSIVGLSILLGTPQFVYLKSLEIFENRTREDESLFTMAMRALLSGQNVKWMGQPPHSPDLAPNDFFLFPHISKILRGQRFSPYTNFC